MGNNIPGVFPQVESGKIEYTQILPLPHENRKVISERPLVQVKHD